MPSNAIRRGLTPTPDLHGLAPNSPKVELLGGIDILGSTRLFACLLGPITSCFGVLCCFGLGGVVYCISAF